MLPILQTKLNVFILLIAVALAQFSSPTTVTAHEANDVNVADVNLSDTVLVEDPNLEMEPRIPGRVEGTGRYFEVTDSNYLNITFESSEPVHLVLESVPEMVVMEIEVANDANWSEITLGGFEPNTTYYKYEDDYHNLLTLTTDVNGSYSYIQDLNEPHLVFIQQRASTIFLSDSGWSREGVGTWDHATLTATLTTDVYETIQIDSDGITLDGNDHAITGPGTGWGSGNGIYLTGRTGVTIKKVNIQGFTHGIAAQYYCCGNTLTDNILSNNVRGIDIYGYSNNNTLTGNTISNNSEWGIRIGLSSNNNTLTCNALSANRFYGILLSYYSENNTLTGNTISGISNVGISLSIGCNSNIVTGNTVSDIGIYGIKLHISNNNEIYNNNFIENWMPAWIWSSSGNVFNLPAPTGGNYWNDWTSPDVAPEDGFVDLPYVFPPNSGQRGQDYLPWTHQDGWIAAGVTPPGTDVVVQPEDQTTGQTPVTLTFDEVTEAGVTTVVSGSPGGGEGPPSGFKVGQPPTIFDINTTAGFEGNITICIDYNGIRFGNELNLKLFHYENGDWVNVTNPNEPPDNPNPDTANKIICGTVTSLSGFAIFEEVTNQPPVANAGGPYVEKATSWGGGYVVLDGTGSSDPDEDALRYEWDLDLAVDSDKDGDPNNDVDEMEPTSTWIFPIGQTEISLVVVDEYGLRSEPTVTTVTVSVIDVAIDIKPGSFPNSINMGSHGVVPLAFLTDTEFDASTIEPATVTLRGEDFEDGLLKLRGTKDAVPMANLEDVDGDGDLDLVVHLETEILAEYELDALCEIGALTYDGYVVSGSDTINIVPE